MLLPRKSCDGARTARSATPLSPWPLADEDLGARHRTERGWTLIELMVVLAIIALIGALVGPALLTQSEEAKVKAADAQVKMLRGSLLTYRLDVGQFPSTMQGLGALNAAPQEAADYWRGPYLDDEVPLDPWRKPYVYQFPADTRHGFELYSLGADSALGGDGTNADIGLIAQTQPR